MTIYAIVNDFPQARALCDLRGPFWTLISPSAILQGGNPYFVPDFSSRFEARPALAIRIGKLGKGIAPRFAYRYVEAAAPAVLFVAADRLDRLKESGLPWTPAISYDRSLAIGKFKPVEYGSIAGCSCSVILEPTDGSDKSSICTCSTVPSPEETLEAVSRDNTMKTGDILLLGLSGSGPAVTPGIKARLMMSGTESLRFNIR